MDTYINSVIEIFSIIIIVKQMRKINEYKLSLSSTRNQTNNMFLYNNKANTNRRGECYI